MNFSNFRDEKRISCKIRDENNSLPFYLIKSCVNNQRSLQDDP
jgi:hypothetical protein